MKIGIDARLINETGVGRYIRNLLDNLAQLDEKNDFVVFLRREQFDAFSLPNPRWQKVLADIPWHSVREQMVMPWIFKRAGLDLLHVPYFNMPIFYLGKMVVTIHDLIILHVDTGKASTRPWVFYQLRRLAYRILLRIGLVRANHIIAVSETTKQDIIKSFRIEKEKITVTYEGVDAHIFVKKISLTVPEPYYLYVGNAYPHKNLETLITAATKANVRVVYVGKKDFFYTRLGLNPIAVTDEQLANLYMRAKALVFPSLMEGFGLPALEALSFGCPVICSDIPIFHEILGDQAMYFDPENSDELAKILNNKIFPRTPHVQKKYNWIHMAEQTLNIYENSTGL